MSASNAQVSATISTTTKEMLDRFTEERGFEQSFVVEPTRHRLPRTRSAS